MPVDEGQIIDKLKTMVSERRFSHSLRVRDTALDLAKRYDVDPQKVNIAALLHDCAKGYSCEELLKFCDEYNLEIDQYSKLHKQLIHAPLGAKIAHVEFGVEDEEILNAICYHTTGRENMSMMEKIICTADYIEPKRSFEGVDEIRELAYVNIDRALFVALGKTMEYILLNNYILHPLTVIARNSLLIEMVNSNIIEVSKL